MSLWDAILQGIIQGLTEFLPVSSSGHLSLYQHFTGQSGEAAGLFSILLHLGTLAAVCIAFWDTIWGMIVEFFRKCLSFRQENSWDATKVLVISVPRSSMISRSQL